ncbi:cytochrome c oxidase assembly factor Coa1 family protein [Myxococcus sp. Y35]|uniref:cytochrome c oxidase assembly factor Coa1 family protein n=1 Tax=Pseudomyxococcus flavus TaxID=3115648 RepID=UPI003CF2EC43
MDTVQEGSMAPRPGWWSRNWRWAAPLGCLGLVASCACLGMLVVYLGFTSLGRSEAHQEAVAIASEDPEVQRALGTPIESGLPRRTSTLRRNGTSRAQFSLPLEGPRGEATLHAQGEQRGDGPWRFNALTVHLRDGTVIDLLRDDATPPPELPLPAEPPYADEAPEPEEEAPRDAGREIEL